MSERPTNEKELIELIRAIDVPAPERLHNRTAAMIARERTPARERAYSPRMRLGAVGGLVVAAVIVLAVVLGSSGGGGGGTLSLRSATALTLGRATSAPPAESPSHRAQLAAAVEGVAFPYWGDRFGWRTTGSRSDRLGGRKVTTVFYGDQAGQRIGYSIVAGAPPPHFAGGEIRWRGGSPYHLSRIGGDRVVTWLRGGHLCIVAGHVSGATLVMLASWHDHAAVA